MELAEHMRALGAKPTIVTAQWEPAWPKAAAMREVPLVRLSQPSAGSWGRFRYLRALARWLRRHAGQHHVVYVAGMRHDAYAALGAKAYCEAPVLLRAEGSGEGGDCWWLTHTRQGRRCLHRAQTSELVVATNSSVESELIENGFDQRQVRLIPLGIEPVRGIGQGAKVNARAALHNINPDLLVPEQGFIALTVCRLHRLYQLDLLLKPWRRVIEVFPNAKLWIVGDGPDRENLYERIVHLGMRQNIFLPGTFDDIDELMRAADFYLAPPNGSTDGFAILKAMSARLPVLATNTELRNHWIGNEHIGLFVSYRDADELASRVTRLFQDVAEITRIGSRAQQLVEQNTMKNVAQCHLDLFEELINKRHAKAS
jgi:glycosyltransferase involved in cell wall biosynthesis